MKGSINDTGVVPCHGCSPAKKSNLNFMLPSVLKRFRRHLLVVPAGCDVCCTPDGRVRSPPSRQEVDGACPGYGMLGFHSCSWTVCDQMTPAPRFWSCFCIGRGHAHVQGGPNSWDSSGSENISQPGLRCCEPSGFRCDAWVCEFQSAHHSMKACVVSSRSFGGAAVRTRVQVMKPLAGDVRVAQVSDSRNLLPSSFGEECALQTPVSSPIG